jgi:cellobiose phosphorylase
VRRAFRNAIYDITVHNPEHVNRGIRSLTMDGELLSNNLIPVFGDGQTHHVRAVMGSFEYQEQRR